jgi:hypothetical protein
MHFDYGASAGPGKSDQKTSFCIKKARVGAGTHSAITAMKANWSSNPDFKPQPL